MAEGFDYTVTEEFINFIKSFKQDTMPRIKYILKNFPNKSIKILSSYREIEEFTDNLRKEYAE